MKYLVTITNYEITQATVTVEAEDEDEAEELAARLVPTLKFEFCRVEDREFEAQEITT